MSDLCDLCGPYRWRTAPEASDCSWPWADHLVLWSLRQSRCCTSGSSRSLLGQTAASQAQDERETHSSWTTDIVQAHIQLFTVVKKKFWTPLKLLHNLIYISTTHEVWLHQTDTEKYTYFVKKKEVTKLSSCTCPGCIILLKHPVARITWGAILKEIALGVILRRDIYCNMH